ncbi:MAG: CoA pyrophosphatase [Firmicutes bacterium]|nr:CoA pyrophosphatase [Alicyclobacillaceae bacterium]MCL6498020.1 CoA pyrophosphatase [Bacillota bacterium]
MLPPEPDPGAGATAKRAQGGGAVGWGLAQGVPPFRGWTKPAAVMAHLAPCVEGWAVLLIRRPSYLREHAGQVALPGGRFDPALDPDLWHTAVRESEEEVGLRVEPDQRLGYLDPIFIPASGYTVLPCVAAWPTRPQPRPQPAEVADWAWAPLAELRAVEHWVWRRETWVPEYPLAWARVWGATARILRQLLAAEPAKEAEGSAGGGAGRPQRNGQEPSRLHGG